MKLNLSFYIMVGGLFILSFSALEQENADGEITGIIELSESRSTQSTPVGRYRRGTIQPQERTQNPVLIWLVDQNGRVIQENDPVVLDQEDLKFKPQILAVRKNGIVRIRNSDPVYHNVFSLSSTKRFDVGRRPQGEYLDVKFDKQGMVDVFCDIHSNMHAIIYVVEPETHSWTSNTAGQEFTISSVPDGNYTLKIFAPGQDLYSGEISIREGETKDLGTISLL